MQIAKMFASLGFKVDLSGLDKFKASLASARGEMTNLGRGTGQTTRKLRGLSRALDSIDSKLKRVKGSAVNQSINKGYNDIAASVRRIDSAFKSIANNQKITTKALGKIHASVRAGVPLWLQYKTSVLAVRDALRQVNARIDQIRAKARIRINLGSGGTGSGNGRGRGSGGGGNNGGNGLDLSGGGFFRSMFPAMAMTGGLTSLGFLGKEVVNQGREQTRMESVLQATSKDASQFGDTLKYVREEALRLGLSSVELGKSFAQINMSAGDKLSQNDKKEMFTGMSEFMMAMGTGKDDQKGIFRAINQMFSNTRILQEEINQLSERGIPATIVWDAAKKAYGIDDVKTIKKMQEKGQLDPAKVLPVMAKMMQEMVHKTGAFDKMLNSSIVKQGQFFEKLSQMSKQIMDAGLDVMLGKVFGKLSEIADMLKEITDGFKKLKKTADDATGGNGLMSIGLTLLLGLLLKNKNGVINLVKGLFSFSTLMRFITGFLNGGLGQAIIRITKRFGWWGLAVAGVLTLMQKIGNAMKRSESGEWTWIDTLSIKFKILQNHLAFTMAKLKVFWHNAKISLNPFWQAGEEEHLKTFGSGVPMTGGMIGNKQAGVEAQKKYEQGVESNRKALANIAEQANKVRPPLANAGRTWNKITVPAINVVANVDINGIPVPKRQISVSEAIHQ